MKRKVMAMVLTLVMVLSLTACGTAKSESASTAKTVKIGMVTDVGGVNDGSFNQSAWEGLQKASTDLGVEVKYLESKTDADYAPNVESFVDGDYDLIICVGYMLADATKAAAKANPDQKFAIIDDNSMKDISNVTCLMFEQSQASYLVGLVAGMSTKTNTVGFVLGMANATMNQFGYGYLAGVIDANPKAKILQTNANAFGDTAGGKSAAIAMVTKGADVIFHAAGGTGLGVIEGCVESKISVIGVDSDQSKLAPKNMLTSAMKRVDNACYDVAKSCKEGTIKGGEIIYDLKTGGVDIAPTTTNLSQAIITAVDKAKESIKSGTVTVPKTQAQFEAKYGNVYELD